MQSRLSSQHLHRHTPTPTTVRGWFASKAHCYIIFFFLVMPGIEPGTSIPENIFSSLHYINFY